uniref:Elongation factor Ts, mitochondrial n=2 Tax=Acrobeloides nanus TaxID=290746 RepID=A0A914DU65_9BILA
MFRLAPIFSRLSVRAFSSATASQQSVSKDALMKLRKRTGYSYVNCRKALLQFGDNNIAEAEKWLREVAEKEGWAKAAKVGGRETTEGLLSVYVDENMAAVVELKSETDFVARNDAFKQLVEEITMTVHEFGKTRRAHMLKFGEENFKCRIDKGLLPFDHLKFSIEENLESLPTLKNRTVKEALAMTIGKLGENITITKAEIHLSPPGFMLRGHAHPKDGTEKMEMGRFISLVGIQRTESCSNFPTEKLAHQLCQHVIGMDPKEVGSPETEEDKQQKAEKLKKIAEQAKAERKAAGIDDDDDFGTSYNNEDEDQLLRQSFMLNPSQSVHEYLTNHGAKLCSFVRIKLGEEETKD